MQKSILFFFLKNKMLSIAFILYIVLLCDFLTVFLLNMLSCPRTAPVINNDYNMRADHFPALLQGLD